MIQNVYGIPARLFDGDGCPLLCQGDEPMLPSWYHRLSAERARQSRHLLTPSCDVDDTGYTWGVLPICPEGQHWLFVVGPLVVQSLHVRFHDQLPQLGGGGEEPEFTPPAYRWDIFKKLLDTACYQLCGPGVQVRVPAPMDSGEDRFISYEEYLTSHPDEAEQRRCGHRLLQFAVNCIEQGNAEDLYMVLSDPATTDFILLLLNSSGDSVIELFSYVAALSTAAAIQGSGLELEATVTYDKYMKQIRHISILPCVVQCMTKLLLDLVHMVRQQKTCKLYTTLVKRVLEYIGVHIGESINISDMARAVGVSAGYLMRNFKKETGKTVNVYIREEKLKRACVYLKFFDYSIIDISERLAFCSQSHFSGCFREIYSITPGEYRRKHSTFSLG